MDGYDAEPQIMDLDENSVVGDARKTSQYMTKYERARLLGTRALQIRFVAFLSLFFPTDLVLKHERSSYHH